MTRNFDVFEAWLNPEMIRKWFFTLEGTNKVAQNNSQVGGTWEIIDHQERKNYRAIKE